MYLAALAIALFGAPHARHQSHPHTVAGLVKAAHHNPHRCTWDGEYGPKRILCVIRVVFGKQADRAIQIASCESHLNPRAISRTGDHGLFQINRQAHADYFVGRWRSNHAYDPVYNALYAYRLSRGGTNWSAWACAHWRP